MPTKQNKIDGDVVISGRVTALGGLDSEEISDLKTKIETTKVDVQNVQYSEQATKLAITEADAEISLRPTYTEILSGFKQGGGTDIPTAPIISATSGFRAISLTIDKQANLTCFDHYEIQVAEAAEGPWYAPRLDGSDWKASAYGAASATVEFFVHANIPLAGTTDAPLPRTLYYRACRVTKGGTKSGWSNIASAAATATNTGDITENSITANKLAVGILSAIMAQISDRLIIDSDVGFAGGDSGDVEGNERAYLNESGIAFERYANGIWNVLAKLSRIGLQTPQVFSNGALTIGNGTNKTRRANGFDLGIPYPSSATHVCHFDDDYLDQNGVAYWTLGGSYALDQQEFAILSMAPFSVSGGSLSGAPTLTRYESTGLFGNWWLDFFFAFSDMTGNGTICVVGNNDTYVRLSIQQTSGVEYTAIGGGATYPYCDVGNSGQKAYTAAVIQKQLIVTIVRNGAQETANYTLGDLSGWAHISLGVAVATGYLYGLINMGGIEVAISRSAFNQGGSAAMSALINPEASYTCKIDELMLDLTAPHDSANSAARTKSRIPWAKNDYNSRKFFLDAYDEVVLPKASVQGALTAGGINAADPDNASQNLVRSRYVAGKGYYTKFPDGELVQRGTCAGGSPMTINFPINFYDTNYQINGNAVRGSSAPAARIVFHVGAKSNGSTTAYLIYTDSGGVAGENVDWIAWGRWKA